jgi:adenylate cyclase
VKALLARFGIMSPATATKAATVPMCAVCAGYPLVVAPLVAAGIIGSGAWFHLAIPILAPLNLWLLRASSQEHGKPLGFLLALASIPFILAHLAGHLLLGVGDEFGLLALIWAGGGLLVAGIMVDWWEQRKMAFLGSCATPEGYWRAILSGEHPGLRRGRHLFGLLPSNPRCKFCNAPFAGPFVLLMSLLGKRPSPRNPRFCGDCLTKAPLGGAEIALSLLFADVRGSTALAEQLRPSEFASRMNRFYKAGTDVLIHTDALIDKFMGDEVIGLYVPGFAGPEHAKLALQAAQKLLHATGHADPDGPWLPIGVGVHTGIAYVGAVGSEGAVSDVTVLGDAANIAARLASMAAAGEVLISASASNASGMNLDDLERRSLQLKGRSEPVDVQVFHAGASQLVPVTEIIR